MIVSCPVLSNGLCIILQVLSTLFKGLYTTEVFFSSAVCFCLRKLLLCHVDQDLFTISVFSEEVT